MVYIVFRAIDKTHDDPRMDCRQTKRGDAIVALPDTHQFSQRELTDPQWRIVQFEDMSLDEAQTWCEDARPDDDPKTFRGPPKMYHRRAYRFDFDDPDLPQELRDYLADDTRTQAVFTLSADLVAAKLPAGQRHASKRLERITTWRKRKAPLRDPSVIV